MEYEAVGAEIVPTYRMEDLGLLSGLMHLRTIDSSTWTENR